MSESSYSKNVFLLGQRIKQLRQTQNITQAQLAFEANMPRNQIGRIERGEINTSVKNIFLIASVLNVHPKELWDVEFKL